MNNTNISVFLKNNHRTYDLWAHSVLVLMVLSYTVYFLLRQNFALAIPFIQQDLHFSKEQIGLIMSGSFLIFGIGKFVNGFFSHLLRPKYFLALGLVGSSLMNILFSSFSSFYMLMIALAGNAFFQSIAWPQCVRLLNDWYSPTQLGTRWGIVSVANQFGSFIVFAFFTYVMESYGWRASFILPGIIGMLSALVILFLPLEVPREMGLCSMEDRNGLPPVKPMNKEESEFSNFSKDVFLEIIQNKLLWYVCLATFFLYIVKNGFCSWAPTYLKEAKYLSTKMAGRSMSIFEMAGLVGGLSAGIISDKLFKGRRGPVGTLYMGGMFLLLILLWWSPAGMTFLDIITLGGLGFVMFGPSILVGAASVDFSSKKAAVAANGFVGFFAYFGSSLMSGWFIGKLTDVYGWSIAFLFLIGCSLMAGFFFLLTWNQRSQVLEQAKSDSTDIQEKRKIVNQS